MGHRGDVPDEAAALLDTKTRHQKLIFHLGQRSIEWRLAHGTLDIGACQEVKGQYIGDASLAHDATSRATVRYIGKLAHVWRSKVTNIGSPRMAFGYWRIAGGQRLQTLALHHWHMTRPPGPPYLIYNREL